jgi:GNAT superfamily N-acetyltransferase
MPFSDLALARRLESAEGYACTQYAAAAGAEWIECGGGVAVFDKVDSPVTQSFGLGIFEELNAATLDTVETFFRDRGAHVDLEICPLAGVPALNLLCERGYRPIEISNVMYRMVENPDPPEIHVRLIDPSEAPLWAKTSAAGWSFEHPELLGFLEETGAIIARNPRLRCFLAELDGQPGAAGMLCIHKGVALFGGSSTIPEFRRKGLQGALLQHRMRYAFEQNCDLAMMVAEAGSNSQRNAERKGFRVAYTRTKWRSK